MKRSQITKSNALVEIPGSRVVVGGGTQGIGASIAERFAKAGAEVWIIGRDESKANSVISKLNQVSRRAGLDYEPEHHFFKADLSLVAEAKRIADEIRTRAGSQGVDYLITCQGGPPNGTFKLTSEGNEQHYAVQTLSRFVLAYKLTAETISQPVVKKGVMSIMSPAKGLILNTPDYDDLDLLKANEEGRYGILTAGGRDSVVVTAFTENLANRMPDLSFTHVFPGVVKTDFASNSELPWYVRLISAILGFFMGQTSESYAEVPFYQLANPEGKALTKRGHYWNENVDQVPVHESSLESGNMEKMWKHLIRKLE